MFNGFTEQFVSIAIISQEREEEDSEGVIKDVPAKSTKILTPFEAWENSLMACTSYAQIYLHMCTLENSIAWSK